MQNSKASLFKHINSYALIILFCLSIFIIALRLKTFYEPLEFDISGYAVIANELVNGKKLYADIWDHKPPGIHITFMAAQLLAGYGFGSIMLLNCFSAILSMIGVYLAAKYLSQSGNGGLWAALFWAIISGDLFLHANQPNAEIFMNTCLIWGVVLFLKLKTDRIYFKHVLATGIILFAGTLYKQNFIFFALFMALMHLIFCGRCSDKIKIASTQILLLVLTGFILWVSVFTYFAATGRLEEFISYVFTYNSSYYKFYQTSLVENIYKYFSHIQILYPYFLKSIFLLLCIAFTGMLAGIIKGNRRSWFMFGAYIAAVQVILSSPGRFYTHYYQLWLPVAAIGAGASIGFAYKVLLKKLRFAVICIAIFVSAVTFIFEMSPYRFSAKSISQMKYGDHYLYTYEFGYYLKSLLEPEESFYLWGSDIGLHFSSQKRPMGKIFHADLYRRVRKILKEDLLEKLMQTFKKTPPDLVVFEAGYENGMIINSEKYPPEWLMQQYEPIQANPLYKYFYLYVLKGSNLSKRLN